ncbi:YcaO-like family protein [Kutzneria buriramensis]|nr:YcaO-like family protein [Kutzneria buriramensis]
MRPRLKAGVFFAPNTNGDGAVVSSGGEVVSLRGAATYVWLEKLAPRLTGDHTLEQLTAALPPVKADMVRRLVVALHDAKLLRDAAADEPHTLSADELRAYAAEIGFIEAYVDSPESRFERFRTARVLAVGAGPVLAAAVEAGERAGMRDITVAESVSASMIDDVDVVLYASGDPVVADILDLDEWCAERATVFVPAVVVGDEAWVGPVCGPHRWTSVWHRLPNRDTSRRTEYLTGPVPGIVASHAVFACFEHLTGVTAESRAGTVVRIDLETLRTSRHRAAEHAAAWTVKPAAAEDLLARITELAGGPTLDDDVLDERVPLLTDEVLGILSPPDERDLTQFPLRVLESNGVHGVGADSASARAAAVFSAVAEYAASVVDARRLLDDEGWPLSDIGPRWLDEPPAQAWTLGMSLVDGGVELVPSSLVFNAGRTGLAAGRDWSTALTEALLSHCLHRTVTAISAVGEPFPGVALPASHHLDLLVAAGRTVTVYDVTDDSGVPTFAFCLDGRTVAYRNHLDPASAVEDGLMQTLLAHQMTPPPVPDLPARRRSNSTGRVARAVAPQSALVDALRDNGPVVVPLDHDPAVAELLPYVLRVVLLNA